MTQEEFEEKTGFKPTEKEYDILNNIFLHTGFEKDKFCKKFAEIDSGFIGGVLGYCCVIINDLDKANIVKELYRKEAIKHKKTLQSALLNFLYDNPNSSIVYNELDLDKILYYKIINGIELSDYDKKQLQYVFHINLEEECTE